MVRFEKERPEAFIPVVITIDNQEDLDLMTSLFHRSSHNVNWLHSRRVVFKAWADHMCSLGGRQTL